VKPPACTVPARMRFRAYEEGVGFDRTMYRQCDETRVWRLSHGSVHACSTSVGLGHHLLQSRIVDVRRIQGTAFFCFAAAIESGLVNGGMVRRKFRKGVLRLFGPPAKSQAEPAISLLTQIHGGAGMRPNGRHFLVRVQGTIS